MFVSKLGIAAVFAAGLGCIGAAEATPIATTFNFNTIGQPTADTGDVTTAAFITDPGPSLVAAIITDNTGLVSGVTPIALTSPTPVTLGASFTKMFTTALGTFQELLTVSSVTIGATSRAIAATGTISETSCVGTCLTSTSVFYSAAYTQNGGPGAQINVSYNDSTTPPPPPPPPPPSPTPEPASLALLGAGLAGLGAVRRRRKA